MFDETTSGARNESPAILKAMKAQSSALEGKEGGILLSLSRKNGDIIERYDIDAPPVFDGLVAANGALYMSLKDGAVQCWKRK